MPKGKRKKPKPGSIGSGRPRNPFAGRKRSGAGFHSEDRYGKKDRREGKKEIEQDDPPAAGQDDGSGD